MFHVFDKRHSRSNTHSNRRANKQRTASRSRRLGLESLEDRQMLSATALKLYVVNDATANVSYRYDAAGASLGNSALVAPNAAPRGAASMIGVDNTWVIDANRTVYVYNATGGLLGSWSAGSMPNNATPEGIATNGTDIWIVDGSSDKVYRYVGAASRLTGTQAAASNFSLNSSNTNPRDIVTDGASLWVVDDAKKTDKVFKYSTAGSLMGSWTIDPANKTPTGIAIDPANVGDMWIVDSGTDRVYKYIAAVSRTSGNQAATASFALSSANTNPQGIVVAGRPWSEAPYQVEWIRQFGNAADDWGRGVAADAFGNIYVSGVIDGTISPSVGTPYLAQFDAAGNLNWRQLQAVNHEALRIAADSLGNVFQVVGNGTDGSPASLNNYDAAGTLRWTVNLPGVFGVSTDDLGYAYTTSYQDTFLHLRKFDALGNVVWHKTLDTGGFVNASGVSADHLGNVYVAAYTNGALLGPYAGDYDAVLVKYSDAGVLQWSRQFGTSARDLAFQVEADPFGNVYTSGQTTGSLGGPNAGDQDNFLAKHDAAGNLLWIRQFGNSGNDSSSGSWVDPLGNVYRAMSTRGSLGGAHLGDSDIVVAKYDPSGELRWATQLGTSGLEIPGGGISGDDQGNIYVAGRTTGSLEGSNAGGSDAVLIKLSPPVAPASSSSLNFDVAGEALIPTNTLNTTAAIETTNISTARRGNFVPASSSNNCGRRQSANLKPQFIERADSHRQAVSLQ